MKSESVQCCMLKWTQVECILKKLITRYFFFNHIYWSFNKKLLSSGLFSPYCICGMRVERLQERGHSKMTCKNRIFWPNFLCHLLKQCFSYLGSVVHNCSSKLTVAMGGLIDLSPPLLEKFVKILRKKNLKIHFKKIEKFLAIPLA